MTVRCPVCQGLRGITRRNAHTAGPCRSCRSGDVVPKSRYHNFWLERYTIEEIEEMGKAIWG